ncbi:MAG TPA: hypothetical protein VGV09_04055 [Steroidobacteraceae bacterium]|nr:hypothetical protein [Steroidobacteraceae bacterium]
MAEDIAAGQQSNCIGKEANTQDPFGDTNRSIEGNTILSKAQEPALMLEAHAPHKAIHSWMDFFIHIATIVVGLIIAVALEQTVEFVHHRHQRLELEVQMHDVFEKNLQLGSTNSANLNGFRSYLVDLQKAVVAKRQGRLAPAAPAAGDPRSVIFLNIPGLAPYEAAKENGTVALLPADRIRIYNRIESQGGYLANAVIKLNDAMAALNAFNLRFDQFSNGFAFVEIGRVPDLAQLEPSELAELQTLIGALINATDFLSARGALLSIEYRAALDGARDDNAFIDTINLAIKANSKLGNRRLPDK